MEKVKRYAVSLVTKDEYNEGTKVNTIMTFCRSDEEAIGTAIKQAANITHGNLNIIAFDVAVDHGDEYLDEARRYYLQNDRKKIATIKHIRDLSGNSIAGKMGLSDAKILVEQVIDAIKEEEVDDDDSFRAL